MNFSRSAKPPQSPGAKQSSTYNALRCPGRVMSDRDCAELLRALVALGWAGGTCPLPYLFNHTFVKFIEEFLEFVS